VCRHNIKGGAAKNVDWEAGVDIYFMMGLLGSEGGLTGLEVVLLSECFDRSRLVFSWWPVRISVDTPKQVELVSS